MLFDKKRLVVLLTITHWILLTDELRCIVNKENSDVFVNQRLDVSLSSDLI